MFNVSWIQSVPSYPVPARSILILLILNFCVVTPCGLVERYKRFRGTYRLHLHGYYVLLRVKDLTLVVLIKAVEGTNGPCQKHETNFKKINNYVSTDKFLTIYLVPSKFRVGPYCQDLSFPLE